jgi:ubiquinone/menaquinone biosynthesis C-methylase UbiE
MSSGRSYWDRHAKNYDRSMRLFGAPLPRMIELVVECVRKSDRVLEVAAGTGLVTEHLARAAREVVATDYAPAMVEQLRARIAVTQLTNVTCEQADLYALRYEAASFDVVVAANVLHLVPDLAAALKNLLGMVRPRGKLVVPTYCHDQTRVSWLVSRALALTGFPSHRRLTRTMLEDALAEAGAPASRVVVIDGVLPITFAEATSSARPTEG